MVVRTAASLRSVRAQCQATNRRDSSSPFFVRRGIRRPLPSLTHVRERSAERRYFSVWHLAAACRVTRHARLPALHCGDFSPRNRTSGSGPEGGPSRYPGAFAPFIRSRPATEGSPRSRADGSPRRPGAGIANPRPQAPHLAPPTRRLMRAPSIEQGMPSVQGHKNGTIEIRITLFARWGSFRKTQ